MKSNFIVVLLCLVFASCGSFSHFEKRHYRSGFYIDRNESPTTLKANSDTSGIVKIKSEKINNSTISFSEKIARHKSVEIDKKEKHPKQIAKSKIHRKNNSAPIDIPEGEPVNKKAKAAYILLNIARLFMFSAIILLFCSQLLLFFILAGIAALVAFAAILFGVLAKKEIAEQDPVVRELGSKKAEYAIQHAVGGLVFFTFLILLAIIVDWIQRKNGH